MTCIIGLVHEKTVYIGADSAAVAGYQIRATALPKIFHVGNFLIGYTSSFRMGQVLQCALLPEHDGEKSVTDFILTDFIDAVRTCFKEKGFAKIENNEETGGFFLVGYKGRLFRINDDFGVTEPMDGIAACGCGEAYALGAMMALDGIPPRERITRALEITAYFCSGVSEPIHTLWI